jgi:MauM/NapG family ferredoxin protein
VKPEIWRRIRQAVQILAILLFLYLFIQTNSLSLQKTWSDLFYRLDPLVALTAMLAGRVLIPGLGLAVLTLVVTLIFGRIWCGWFCPLGTILEWLAPRRSHKRLHDSRQPPSESWRLIKYFLLLVMVFAALLGNQTLLLFDPITIMTRTMSTAVWPGLRYAIIRGEVFLYNFPSLWGILDTLHNAVISPLFQDVDAVFILAMPIFLFFIVIVVLNWWAERFWCRYLCPLGGLLGLVSRLAFMRREVGEVCNDCGLCSPSCPTGTIDPQNGYRSDPAECTVCYDCIVACKRQGVNFQWQIPAWKPAQGQEYDLSRRQALKALGVAVVGVALAGVEPITVHQPTTLIRPPGARLTPFEALCIRCGECVRVCPTQGLQASLFEAGWANTFTPMLVPRLGYCSFPCNACSQVCPSGAIPSMALEKKQETPIGLARVDRNRCLPWAYQIACIICEEVCPVADKAVKLEEIKVVNTPGEAVVLQRPSVVKDLCIGCGICEYKCPMGGEAAIRVFSPTNVSSQGGLLQ